MMGRVRIVSLLPSATEIVCALGLDRQLVGVTHECDYPEFVQQLPKVTRTLIPTDAPSREIDRLVREKLRSNRALYSLDMSTLEALQPDLIVTQTLCDVCAVAEDEVRAAACALPSAPFVVDLEPQTLSEVFDSIQQVARAAGVESTGEEVLGALKDRVERVAARTASASHRPRVVLLEWLDPPFSCGHWNPELVRLAGGVEMLGQEGQPSRTLRWEEVRNAEPDVVFIACCGFGVERTLRDVNLLPALGTSRVYVADGSQYFSRPGPRLVDSLEILAHALRADLHRRPAELASPVLVSHGSAR